MDCLKAINALHDRTCNWRIEERAVVEECIQLTKAFDKVRFKHTRRDGNRLAHTLAQEAIRSPDFKEWHDTIPPSISSLFLEECM